MARFIQRQVREVLKKRQSPEAQIKRKEKNQERDFKDYTPKEIIEALKKEYSESGVDCKLQVERIIRANGGEMITHEKFRDAIYNQLKFVGLSKNFIENMFKKLDPKKTEKASINHLPALIYGDTDANEKILMLPPKVTDLYTLVSEAAHFHYDNPSRFTQHCRHAHVSDITKKDFEIFTSSFTRLKKPHSDLLFEYIDDANEGVLKEGQILSIFEHWEKLQKEKDALMALDKSRQDDKVSSLLDLSKNFANLENDFQDGLMGIGKPGTNEGLGAAGGGFDIQEGGDDAPDSSVQAPHNRVPLDELEELAMKIGARATFLMRNHGLVLKPFYKTYADKVTTMMKFDEFKDAITFIISNPEEFNDFEATLHQLFTIVAWPATKEFSWILFKNTIEMGKKINPVYVKLKLKYGEKFNEVKSRFIDEINKLNIKRGDGFVSIFDIKKMFKLNAIEITNLDQEVLIDEGLIVQKDKTNMVEIKPFIEKVFIEHSAFSIYMQKRAISKIFRRYRKYKQEKLVKEQREKNVDAFLEGWGNDESAKGAKLKISPKSKPKPPKKIKPLKSPEERMKNLLPKDDTKTVPSAMTSVHYQKLYKIAEKLINEILDDAVHRGEVNLLKKTVQRRFANRSVSKDNVITIQEESFSVSNILPRSVSGIPSIGRLFYMSNDALLNQFDLTNNQMLPSVDLSSKIPMQKDEILDYLLDEENAILYVLKMSWILESWNIFQKSRSPSAKVRLVQNSDTLTTLSQVYKNRYLGAFPHLLSLSQSSGQYLIVNSTMVNGTIYFLDPISLSILEQSKPKSEDLNISPQLNKIFYQLKPMFVGSSTTQNSFDRVFGSEVKVNGRMKYIRMETFKNKLLQDSGKLLAEAEIGELVDFLNVNEDDYMDEDEWGFLADNVRISGKKSNVHASYEIPEELRDIDRNVAKIFYDMYDFVQKKNIAIDELFKIFDGNNSGSISEAEFMQIINEISKEANYENKRKFFRFLDKDNSRTIEIEEFCNIFKMFGKYSPQELFPSETPRHDFYVILEKAFEYGLDLEQEFLKYDELKDGGIPVHTFICLIKNLPFGITDGDIEYYLENILQFTNEGNIDYLSIFTDERFKRIKYIYQIKRGFTEYETMMKDSEDIDKYVGLPKIVIESVIHLSCENVFIYTTVSPKTSNIYIARTKEDKIRDRQLSEVFESQLLAKLIGHKSKEPPTIMFVKESNCLLSGEKLSPIKESMSETMAPQNKSNESFARFYSNITNNKTRVANILVWNLGKDVFNENKTNPPWKISPTRIIENAHYDSITCLAYMPLSQIIVSTSIDGSIKLWDPVARPYSLVHHDSIRKHDNEEEQTQSNVPFSEVSRFYTGELTCYSLICMNQRVPVPDTDGVPKFKNLEYLVSLELGKAQRTAGKLRTEGIIKVFGIERITIDVPVSRFEETIPKQLWQEMVDLAISNRQNTKFLFKRSLSTNLDKLMSKVVIQKTEVTKIPKLLKSITLDRFVNSENFLHKQELFNLLIHLPMRNPDSNHKMLSIDEVHMHLKRNNFVYPSNLSKDAFVKIVQDIIEKSSHYMVDHRSKNQNKFLNMLSQKISKKEIDIAQFFPKVEYSRNELNRMLGQLGGKDDEIEELLISLDPFYSNIVKLETIKTFFSSEIINSKMNEFARPNYIITHINAKLSRSNKVELLRNLFSSDSQGTGKVSMLGFLQSFSKLSRTIDENMLKELFELLSDKEEDGEQSMELSYFCKKLLTHSEQFELARVYNALAKIKNALRFRLKTLEDLFVDEDADFKGKSIQNLTVKVGQFIDRIKELDIVGLTTRDLSLVGNFLSSVDEDGNTCISLINLNAYFKKIELKYQYTELSDYKLMVKELKKILGVKEEFRRKWSGVCHREMIGFGEMRILLNHFNINEDIIDLILLKFVESEISSVSFFNKIQAFIEMNSFLDDTSNLRASNVSAIASKLFQEEQNKLEEEKKEMERPRDTMDDLVDLMEKYETKKTVMSALNVCKKFDKDNTGRVTTPDFVNILWYNLEMSKYGESESVLLAFQNEMIIKNNFKTIEYSEIFDRLESRRAARLIKANTEKELPEQKENEVTLTRVISNISDILRNGHFKLHNAFLYFDRDNVGLILVENFRKILEWGKISLNEEEEAILEDNLMLDNAINYRKFLDLIYINDKHINVQFDAEIWCAISKNFPLELFENLNPHLEALRYYHKLKKDNNPLVSASVLGQILREMSREFSDSDIDLVLKYAVVGSINNLSSALNKLERNDLTWEFEYAHMPHFLTSVPVVLSRKREMPEHKDNATRAFKIGDDKDENTHIISKVKAMLRERGVTMWECIFSCSTDYIEQSRISKYNFLRMLKMIDIDLTMKEKVILVKVLDPQEAGRIELNTIIEKFQAEGQQDNKGVREKLVLEKLVYNIYYGGHDLDSAFEAIDKDKKKLLSQKEFGTGLNNLNLDLSMFEINYILGLFGLDDRWSTIKKSDFTKKLKKLMKKHSIDPTSYFSSSLFPQIKNLVDKKNKHLRECFEEEDLHKSGYADLEMMKRALKSFGLSNLRIHHIKTLIKLMDVNMVQESEESSSEDKNDGTMDLGISLEKPKKDEKKATGLDIDDPNFRIDYNELVKAVYEEVENNSKHAIQQANLVLKKVQTQFKMKEFTIFEAYVYFDVNNQNVISNLQFKIGIQNLNANSGQVETSDMKIFWDILDKNNENKVTFNGFFSAFIDVGSIDIIKFDEKIVKLLKKFCFLVSKKGSLEEIFKKFDVNQNGSVKLDEFRQQCEKLNLDFKEEELSEIFKVFCNPELINPQLNKKHKSMDDDRDDEIVVSHRAFNFKNLVAVATFFRRKDNMYKLLHRFDSMLQERALSYNKIFEDYCGLHKEKKTGSSAKNPPKKGNKMVVHTLTMTELKNMLRSLKLAFSNDELNQLCDAFESETITAKQMERSIKKVVEMIEKDKDEKKTFLLRIVQEIEEGINSKNSSLQKIFFEFDGRSDGRLKLDELSQMLGFLKVKATKTEIKAIFEEMDFDRKGNVTIKEFQAFLDQVHFNTHKKDDHIDQADKPSSGLEQVLKTLQDASSEKQTSLERVIQSQGVEINQIASVKSIEKVFKELGCVLKREDVKIIIEAASKDSSCSWGDLMDWGIKNNIDFRTKEKVYSQFPPSVQVILSKMLQAFKKMNISIETAFKYFTKDHGDRSMKNEFLTLVQGLQIPTSEEELLGLYNFFDERNYGEISKSSFIEKCEIARDFYKWSDNLSDTTEKKGLTTLTLRQHVITILEKLYISFLEKNYNKKQIFAVFDKHGNGIISRDEFVKICENLGMPIAKDYHSSLLNFIDPTESNVINLTSLINKMEESVPEHAKDSLKNTQGQTILRDIVGKLKVHYSKFIWECLDLEKKLQMNDLFSRIKTGISMYDFYRLLATYGIRLQEGDKMILNAAFKNKTQPDYFDTEKLYLAFDKIHKESGLLSDIEGENLEAWESNILRRVADRLRSMNLSLDKALGNIHSNSLGFMKVVDFKQLLFSLDINLSQKDVDLLIKQMANRNNPNLISVEDFKQRFWACFFEGKAQLNPLNIDTRSRQIAGMLHHKIRFEMKMPLSLAWDKLDQRKEGIATIDDLKEFMLEIKMPITKEDLGSLFTLIDQGEDNYIDQFEFMQFWDHNFAADFETKKKKQKNLESEVLGRIVKVLNQSEIDFIKLLRQREPTKGDYLDERQFSKFLVKMGLNIEESKIRDVMTMMNSGNPEKISFNQLETSLLRHGLKARERKNETKVDFSDQLLMTFLNALNLTANKMKFKVKDLVKEYDEDYDGYLTTKEFYNLISSLEKPFKMSEIQRLAHNFASYNSINKISIDKIVQAQIEQDHANLTVDKDLCDGDAFGAVLEHFDPTLLLFRKWSKLKQTKIRFEKFLDYNKDKLRGLRLLSVQHKLKQLDFKMGLILKNIKLVMQYLNNTSTQAIKNEALVKWIDPALCSLSMNKKELQNIVSKQDSYMVNEYSSSQQFNLRFDAVEQFNRFFSIYKGEVLAEGGKESSVRIYTSETLKRISKDGKFFEDHLMYTIKLQTLLQHQYPDIFARIYGYYSRKVGVDPKDRDVYVFYEVLGSEWVSLRDFITSTGGLVRIPFLVTSNSVFHVIKYWFQKILAIVDVCNQNAVCLYLLRPENLYVNHKTLEVKLLSLSGSARISYEGTLSNVSDLNIVLPSATNLEGSPVYFKEENFANDPYLAPEFFYTVGLTNFRMSQKDHHILTAGV